MGRLATSLRNAVIGWLLMFVLLTDSTNAAAQPVMQALTATATVMHPCTVAVIDTPPEKLDTNNPSQLVRVTCHKTAAWRVEVRKTATESTIKRIDYAPLGSGDGVRLTINF